MIAAVIILVLALNLIVVLSAAPRRTLVAVPAGLVTMALLIEGAGVGPRAAIAAGLLIALLLSFAGRVSRAPAADPRDAVTIAADAAWTRLAASAGLLTRGRIAGVRRRRDVLVSRGADVDPFSTFGELRLKLERRVPELIENYLDEAATAPAVRRHMLMSELLGEVEKLVARAEAVDPAVRERTERRTALKNHLGSGSDQRPIE